MRLGDTGTIQLLLPFDAVTQAQLRAVRPRGRWSSRLGCWDFPLEAAAVLQRQFGQRFALEPPLPQWFTWLQQPLPPLPPHRELVAAADLPQPLPDGRQLFAHQRAAVRWLLARRGALLADAMGLGKTLTALVAARALVRAAGCRIVVIAPSGLHAHWRQEAAALQLRLELLSWAQLPSDLPEAGTVLIADEAHYAQNLSSQRTRAFLRLSRHPRLRAAWLLTGTPMKNGRPAQLFPLLAAIGHPLAFDQRAFEERYCLGHWSERGGQRHWLAQGFDHRLSLTVEDYRRRAAAGLVRRDAEALAVFTALRQIAADYKLPAAAALVKQLLGQGECVVLFTAFVAAAQLLQAQLGGVLLTGRQPVADRQRLVDGFQAGEERLLISTFGTGGLGFTLHRARHVVLLERPWTPGDAEQAEDRCHRIGMGASLQSHWLQLGLADQLVDGLIASKAERIELLLQRRSTALQRQALPAMVRQLLAEW
jgi:hypothetical protein